MKKTKYYFYLNSHDFYKWSRCLDCNNKTKLRKFCLTIHYEDKKQNVFQLICINKSCKFCSKCDLIIGQKSDLDDLVFQIITQLKISFNKENYLVFGTMDRKDWKRSQEERMDQSEAIKLIYPFKGILKFEISPAGWYFDGE